MTQQHRPAGVARWASLASALAAALGMVPAQASYVVTSWDLAGSSSSLLYDINSAGQMVGYADEGAQSVALLIKDGLATRLTGPAGAAGSYASGISDNGTVVGAWSDGTAMRDKIVYSGPINPITGLQDPIIISVPTVRGLIWQNGAYSTFNVSLPGSIDTRLASISSDGRYVLGDAPDTGQRFVLDRNTGNVRAVANISGQAYPRSINNALQAVGDTSPPGSLGYVRSLIGGPTSSFGLAGFDRVAPRAINEQGDIAGWVRNGSGQTQAFVRQAAGLQTFGLAGASFISAYGLNEAGQAVGSWSDAAGKVHGFFATDAIAPSAQNTPGSYQFSVPVLADKPIFIDPVVAVGYVYTLGAGDPMFKTVSLPFGIGDNRYTITVGASHFEVAAQEVFDFTAHGFAGGVSQFSVTGIEPEAGLDPLSPTAFVTRLSFAGNGLFSGSQTALTLDFTPAVPEPGPGSMLLTGLLGLALLRLRPQR